MPTLVVNYNQNMFSALNDKILNNFIGIVGDVPITDADLNEVNNKKVSVIDWLTLHYIESKEQKLNDVKASSRKMLLFKCSSCGDIFQREARAVTKGVARNQHTIFCLKCRNKGSHTGLKYNMQPKSRVTLYDWLENTSQAALQNSAVEAQVELAVYDDLDEQQKQDYDNQKSTLKSRKSYKILTLEEAKNISNRTHEYVYLKCKEHNKSYGVDVCSACSQRRKNKIYRLPCCRDKANATYTLQDWCMIFYEYDLMTSIEYVYDKRGLDKYYTGKMVREFAMCANNNTLPNISYYEANAITFEKNDLGKHSKYPNYNCSFSYPVRKVTSGRKWCRDKVTPGECNYCNAAASHRSSVNYPSNNSPEQTLETFISKYVDLEEAYGLESYNLKIKAKEDELANNKKTIEKEENMVNKHKEYNRDSEAARAEESIQRLIEKKQQIELEKEAIIANKANTEKAMEKLNIKLLKDCCSMRKKYTGKIIEVLLRQDSKKGR